ncbi:hypothetical protein T12_15236 [Trichinella patagoniensis]|uniref:Uncharacterized protein n=1 Tax=Trichinella patagoniensis TaxID=990121 RepID=A0A0V0Z8V6_9BILA|nr:hypothetical protein T12_15236 [Trichinella patagoniensis]
MTLTALARITPAMRSQLDLWIRVLGFGFHRFIYGAYQPQAAGVTYFVHFHASSKHSGFAAVAPCPFSISDDHENYPKVPGMASFTCMAFGGKFLWKLTFPAIIINVH